MTHKNVLLVEDDNWWRIRIPKSLSSLPIIWHHAVDYGEGLAALRRGPYDLIIFDNKLKEISNGGIELMQAANRIMKLTPPMILHSSYLSPKGQEQVQLLCGEYVEKHTDFTMLREVVTRLLA